MLGKRIDDGIDFSKGRPKRLEKPPALLCRRNAAGGTMQQAQAKARFERRYCMADGGRRNGKFGGSFTKAAAFGNGSENGELRELHTVHCSK